MHAQASQSSIVLHVGEASLDALPRSEILAFSCECLSALNSEEALEMAVAIRPDVVLLGSDLDPSDALDLCRSLREERDVALTPVVLIQPSPSAEERLQALEAGVSHIVSSSPCTDELELRLRHVLDQQRSRRALESALKQKHREEKLRSEWVAYTIHELDDCLGDLESEGTRSMETDGLARARRLTTALTSCTALSQEIPLARMTHCELETIRSDIEKTLGLQFSGPALEDEVQADHDLLQRSLLHLTRVALRSSKRKDGETTLSIAARSSAEGPVLLELSVEASSIWHRAFDRLQQGNLLQNGLEFRSREELYLSFCKHALDAMGGDIGVERSENGHLCFWIQLPQPATSLPPNVVSFVPAQQDLTLGQAASR